MFVLTTNDGISRVLEERIGSAIEEDDERLDFIVFFSSERTFG